jgi:hypothetical protein
MLGHSRLPEKNRPGYYPQCLSALVLGIARAAISPSIWGLLPG